MNTTKLMVKMFLVISLFCATAFAEGNMSGGGLADDGNMSGGGLTADDKIVNNGDTDTDILNHNEILKFVRGYLFSLFG